MISNSTNILSIHLNVDGFSFYFFEKDQTIVTKRNYFIESQTPQIYIKHLVEALKKEKTEHFSLIRLIFSNKLFTLVPNELFNENRVSDYIEFNSFLLPNDPIESKLIETLDIQFLHSYVESIEVQIKDLFPKKEVKILHSGYSLINQLSNFSSEIQYFVWFNFSSIELLYFNEEQLIFYNYFETETKEDILYYILFVAQQLEIDVNEIPIHLLGNIEKHSETIAMMKKYIRHVKIGINENITFKEFIL
ncbi:hypothetical protein UJ101_02250 [Flavobacteriaceae bacterium UJ101]|nr:hypothetical protein UJ101_02250 [Flavobacteriaceae bacterium UJ101]